MMYMVDISTAHLNEKVVILWDTKHDCVYRVVCLFAFSLFITCK